MFIFISIILLSFSLMACQGDQEEEEPNRFRFIVDGLTVQQDIEVLLEQHDILVPVELFLHIGAEIHFDEDNNLVTIIQNDLQIQIKMNDRRMHSNDEEIVLNVIPVLHDGKPMVPVSVVSQLLDLRLFISQDQRLISVETSGNILIPYNRALEIFSEGVNAVVTDVETGLQFNVRRVVGGYQTIADVETKTAEDTEILKSLYGGEWSWSRRAIVVDVDGVKIAASISAFPHSGSEEHPFGVFVDQRSGSTGPGINLNYIRNNNMTGVVDIYFFNSLIPNTNVVDGRHQENVLKAAEHYNK